jgi:hypothetical protein
VDFSQPNTPRYTVDGIYEHYVVKAPWSRSIKSTDIEFDKVSRRIDEDWYANIRIVDEDLYAIISTGLCFYHVIELIVERVHLTRISHVARKVRSRKADELLFACLKPLCS